MNTINLDPFLNKNFKERELILTPWLSKQSLNMIYAPRGLGKSHLSLSIACAIGSHTPILKWAVTAPHGVLYIDSEMCASELQLRLKKIIKNLDNSIQAPIKIITPDCQPNNKLPDLATIGGQKAMEKEITDDIDVVIFDNLSSLLKSKPESWLIVQDWLLHLKSIGKASIIIQHANKLGTQRGTSRREDALDVVIALKKPCDYKQSDGARFIVTFEKARSLYGNDVLPFEAQLTPNNKFEIAEQASNEIPPTPKHKKTQPETWAKIVGWSALILLPFLAYLHTT